MRYIIAKSSGVGPVAGRLVGLADGMANSGSWGTAFDRSLVGRPCRRVLAGTALGHDRRLTGIRLVAAMGVDRCPGSLDLGLAVRQTRRRLELWSGHGVALPQPCVHFLLPSFELSILFESP